MSYVKALISVGGLFLLSACAGGPSFGGLTGSSASVNYAAASSLGAELPGRDTNALYPVFLDAMEKGEPGQAISWNGPSAKGTVTPGARKAGNLRFDANELLDFRSGLQLSRNFETDLGEFVLTRNSNVRYGPATEAKVAEILPSGTGVEVVGRTVDAPWMLVAVDNKILGFVYEDLMVRRPGTELELAGGPTRRPYLCRPMEQTLTLYGRTDRWSGVACDKGNGWELQQEDKNAPTRLF